MTKRADGVRVAYPLFRTGGGGSIPTSALQLRFESIDRRTMEELNRHWHSRLPTFRTACACPAYYGAEFDGLWYAVAAWSPPVARLLPTDWLELRRLAIADDAPKNTATRFIGWMVRDIRKRFPSVPRLVSYQDTEAHSGTIYKASGWRKAETAPRARDWNMPGGVRETAQAISPKQRWELILTKKGDSATN